MDISTVCNLTPQDLQDPTDPVLKNLLQENTLITVKTYDGGSGTNATIQEQVIYPIQDLLFHGTVEYLRDKFVDDGGTGTLSTDVSQH